MEFGQVTVLYQLVGSLPNQISKVCKRTNQKTEGTTVGIVCMHIQVHTRRASEIDVLRLLLRLF